MSRYLRRRLELLSDQMADIHKRRSVSESSTSTVSSIQSSNSESGEQVARYDLLSRILADVLMRVQAVAENVFAICCWWNLFLTHAVLSRTIDWTFCPTPWDKSLKPELMSWHPDLCTISVLSPLNWNWSGEPVFFSNLSLITQPTYLGAREKRKEILRLIVCHPCLSFSKNAAGLLIKPEKEAFRVFFVAGAGNMWDISETCQLIFYKTFHTSFSASFLFVFLVSSSCGKYNFLATLAKNGRSLLKNFSLTLYRAPRQKNQKNAVLLPFWKLFLQDPGSFNRWLAWSFIKSLTSALISILEVVHSTRSRISDRNFFPSEIRLLDSYMSALGFMISFPNLKLDLCKFPCTL